MKTLVRNLAYLSTFAITIFSCDFQKDNPEDKLNTSSDDAAVINGIISDESTGNPLFGVNITVNSIMKQSDEYGAFNYGNEITPGKYKLTANKAGFIGITRDIEIMKDRSAFYSYKLFKKEPSITINAVTGGTLGLNSGRILQIAPNSLTQNTDISVTQVLGTGIPIQMDDKFIIEALSLEPDGLVFKSSASLQVPANISGINNNLVKAVSIGSSGIEELPGATTTNSSVTIPISHFSYVYFYLPLQKIRYRKVAYSDSLKPSSAIADCRSEKAKYEVTLSTKVITSSLPENLISAQIGLDLKSSIKRTLVITRKTNEQKKQLYYRISGTRYIFEFFNGNDWNQIANVEVQEYINVVAKDVGICHDQGIGN